MKQSKEHGIEAVNQEFKRYEQVEKDQTYHLVEKGAEDQFDDDYVIETCDISEFLQGDEASKAAFAQKLGRAMEGIGFVVLTGHGIDQALYDEAEEKTREIFEDIPYEERIPYEAERHGSVNQGYFPIKTTTIIHPDLVEGWVFCRRAFDMPGNRNPEYKESDFWPRAGYEPFFRQLCLEHEKLILPIMQSILRYLGCDAHAYDEYLTETNFGFRLNYYPPVTGQDDASGAGRMLGHEDVDLFTILPSSAVEGLQVLNRENMKWIRLNPPKGSIILNTGDYMQRITNNRLPSTTHRVSKPTDTALLQKPRISFPMAVYVWEEVMLEVLSCCGEPQYEPINAETFHTRITSKYYGDDYSDD